MLAPTTRRQFVQTGTSLALVPFRKILASPAGRRPNIVLFLADDLGYGDVGCYGRSDVRTPAIDRLADTGVRFTSSYANAPECSPTRTALLTGRYQQRVGGLECAIGVGNVGRYDDAIQLQKRGDLGLPAEETSIAQLMKRAGYATGICGKWHLGYEPKFAPNRLGFDRAFYLIGGAADYFHHVEPPPSLVHALYLDGEPIRREGYLTDLITREAEEFIERQPADKPFFLYIPYTAPHSPFQGPADFRPAPLPPESDLWNQSKAPKDVYRSMIERMDQGIEAVLKKLADRRLADDTIVVFMSDNGGTSSGINAPFSGAKSGLFEGGIRVPCIVRWPGVLSGGTTFDQPCMTMDFSASLVRAAGAAPEAGREFDGVDVLKHVREQHAMPKRALFWRYRRGANTRKAVREGSLKYISDGRGERVEEYLFDLGEDPAEKNNLLGARPGETAHLKSLLTAWEERVKPTTRGNAFLSTR